MTYRNPLDLPHYVVSPGETVVTLDSFYVRVSAPDPAGKCLWTVGWMGRPIVLTWGSEVDSVEAGTAAGLEEIRSGEARRGLLRCAVELNQWLAESRKTT